MGCAGETSEAAHSGKGRRRGWAGAARWRCVNSAAYERCEIIDDDGHELARLEKALRSKSE